MTGYDTPVGDIEFLRSEIARIDRWVGELAAPSSGQINKQLAALEAAQATLTTQQATLTSQQATLSAQVAFLAGQTVATSNPNNVSGTRGASGGISLDGFDGTYDCAVSLTTSSTGRLIVSIGAQLFAASAMTSILGFDVLVGASVVVGVDWPRTGSAVSGFGSGARTAVVTVAANTAVTVRTRRGWTGGTSGTIAWGYQSLVVSKDGP